MSLQYESCHDVQYKPCPRGRPHSQIPLPGFAPLIESSSPNFLFIFYFYFLVTHEADPTQANQDNDIFNNNSRSQFSILLTVTE